MEEEDSFKIHTDKHNFVVLLKIEDGVSPIEKFSSRRAK